MSRFSRCAVLFLPLLCAGFLFVVPIYAVSADDSANEEINSCTGTVYDADGNAYGVVRVGDQCWMDKNMNVGTMLANALTLPDESNSKMEKWCYGNASASCFSDGGLYSWGEAMQHSASEGARGICPAGWHIPTKTEWYVLVDFLKNPGASCDQSQLDVWQCSDAGTKLKIGGSSGLNIPFGGDRGYSDYDSSAPAATFYNTDSTLMWLSSRFDKDYALFAGITQNNEAVKVRKAKDPVGNSIRCLKDTLDNPLNTLSIEIPKKSASVLSTATPIAFTYKTTLPKTAEGTTLKNRMRIRMTDAFVTMRYDDRMEEDGMTIWKGIYERPIGIVGPFHLAGTLETADCSGDTGTKLNFDINDPTPGIHTVSAVVKDDETMTKTTFVPAEPVSPLVAEEPSFFFKPITYILKHLFGVVPEETKEMGNTIPTEAEPIYASLEEPELSVADARKLCKKVVEPIFVCGSSSVLDVDNNVYGTVQVGTQCWMASNMKVGTRIAGVSNQSDNGIIEKYCYNNEEGLCGAEGGLYQWDEAMQYSTTEGARGICPAGWHIPTDGEQNTLDQYLTDAGQTCNAARNSAWDCSSAGTKLKSGGTSGLNFPLAGNRSTDSPPLSSFLGRTGNTFVWSSSQSGGNAWLRRMGQVGVDRLTYSKALGFSVRCLKD